MKQCKDCQFFHSTDKTVGECRFSPPTPFMVIGKPAPQPLIHQQGVSIQFPAAWPHVPEDAWCGKFEQSIILPVKH